MLKKIFLLLVLLVSLSLSACGVGEENGDGDGDGLTSGEIAAINNVIGDAFNDGLADFNAGPSKLADFNAGTLKFLVFSTPINFVRPCPNGGHISASGNLKLTVPDPPATGPGAWTGQVSFQISDPTNNLNECRVGIFILDGTLFLTISGPGDNPVIGLDGFFDVYRQGTVGLRLVGSCSVFIRATISGTTGGTSCS